MRRPRCPAPPAASARSSSSRRHALAPHDGEELAELVVVEVARASASGPAASPPLWRPVPVLLVIIMFPRLPPPHAREGRAHRRRRAAGTAERVVLVEETRIAEVRIGHVGHALRQRGQRHLRVQELLPRSSPPRRTPPGARARRAAGGLFGDLLLGGSLGGARAAAASAAAAAAGGLPGARVRATGTTTVGGLSRGERTKLTNGERRGRAVSDAFGPRRERRRRERISAVRVRSTPAVAQITTTRAGCGSRGNSRKRADFRRKPRGLLAWCRAGKGGGRALVPSAPSPRPGLAVRPRRCRAWPRDRLHLAEAC